METAALTALILLVLGVLFFLAELLFGSDGSLSIMAAVCWLGAAWFAWQGWAKPLGWEWWMYAFAVFAGIPVLVGSFLSLLPHSPAGKELFPAPDPDEVRPHTMEEDLWRESLIGELAKSLTWMNPGGLVLIDGERQHAETEGLPIEPGQIVEIIDLRGNRFVVRLFEGTPFDSHRLQTPEDLAY